MTARLAIIFALLLAVLTAYSADAAAMKDAVVHVRSPDNDQGAGIVVGANANGVLIITARHVATKSPVTVTFNSAKDRTFSGRILERSDEVDFAVLLVNVPSDDRVRGSLRPLSYRADRVPVATTVSAIGHSVELWTATVGVNKVQSEQLNTITSSNLNIVEGFSGGPLFDSEGRLIGMLTEIDGVKASALRIDAILRLLSLWNVQHDFLKRPGCVVQLRSTPSGATVIVENEKRGTTPMQLQVRENEKLKVFFEYGPGARRESAIADCSAADGALTALIRFSSKEGFLLDKFDDNRNMWPRPSIANGVYRFKAPNHEWRYTTVPVPLEEEQDFSIECTLRKVDGLSWYFFGLIWGVRDANNFFEFGISEEGRILVAEKRDGNTITFNDQSAPNPHVTTSTNTLRIEGTGWWLRFFVNKRLVHEMPFRPFHGTGVGFINHGVVVEIDDVYVFGTRLTAKP